jgi:hypothetical protein
LFHLVQPEGPSLLIDGCRKQQCEMAALLSDRNQHPDG